MADFCISDVYDETAEISWNNDSIREALLYMIASTGQKTMPTHKEIFAFYGNYKLSNAIRRNGGTKRWANELGIDTKECESKLGAQYEDYFVAEMMQRGRECERVNLHDGRFPYDAIVDGTIKVDVKAARPTSIRGYRFFCFNLEKKTQTCDFYVTYCIDEKNEIEKVYVIPSNIMHGKKQLSIGSIQSKYDSYIGRYDLIEGTSDFYAAMNLVKSFGA